jgi:preprotein translocase subunit YajC
MVMGGHRLLKANQQKETEARQRRASSLKKGNPVLY